MVRRNHQAGKDSLLSLSARIKKDLTRREIPGGWFELPEDEVNNATVR